MDAERIVFRANFNKMDMDQNHQLRTLTDDASRRRASGGKMTPSDQMEILLESEVNASILFLLHDLTIFTHVMS